MGTPQIPSVDSDSKQFPDQVRARIASNISDASTPEGAAVAGLLSAVTPTPVVPITAGSSAPLVSYGHSFLAEQGLSDASKYWARRLARALGLTYPTSNGGSTNDLKRAIGGTSIGDTALRVAGATGLGNPVPRWTPGTKALVVIEALMNSLRLNGATTADLTSATNNARVIMAMLSASEIIDDTDARVVRSTGTWTTATAGPGYYTGGTAQYNSANGSYFEFTVPADRDVFFVTTARSGSGAVINVTDQTTSTVLTSGLDLTGQTLGNASPYVYRTPVSARGHTVRLTKTGGTSLYADAVITVSPTPPPVLWMKEPYLANYAASTQFPNGSDAAVDAFNAIVDLMSYEFPNLIVADPNQAGYWDKNTDILTSDQVHPNEKGHLDLARAALDAIRAWQVRKSLAVI